LEKTWIRIRKKRIRFRNTGYYGTYIPVPAPKVIIIIKYLLSIVVDSYEWVKFERTSIIDRVQFDRLSMMIRKLSYMSIEQYVVQWQVAMERLG